MTVTSSGWRKRAAVAAFLAFAFALTGARATSVIAPAIHAVVDDSLTGAHGAQRVIVQTNGDARVAREIARRHGTVTRDLPIVRGFAATLSPDVIDRLAHLSSVRAITLDGRIHLSELPGTPYGPPSVYTAVDAANRIWATGNEGNGVTVAVIDTGVTPSTDLAGRLVQVTDDVTGVGGTAACINFSGESGCQDSYGHGTFVAGVIAGNGQQSSGLYKGVAPKAKILAIKLSGRDGAADVSALLASLQWVVEHKTQYGIRVINLSLGTDSPQSYRIDPLNYAVEQAWSAGIVVVTSASNAGPGPMSITKPADDPWVITVGAVDDLGTVGSSDDVLPNFSGRGPTHDAESKPDLVAPGAHIISLRSPGSAIDANFPTFIGNAYRKGSGTSFAAPQVAGAVALLLSQNPTLTPDRIKFMLKSTARPTASVSPYDVGAGQLDVFAATTAPPGTANQGLVLSTGLGSIDASRGTFFVTTSAGTPVTGLLTQQLRTFDPTLFATTWDGASWQSSQWAGASWQGASWQGAGWQGASWQNGTWDGASWQGASWQGASWQGASWQGASWQGASWQNADGSQPYYGLPGFADKIYGAWE